MKLKIRKLAFTFSALLALAMFSMFVLAQPSGPTSITRGPSETGAGSGSGDQQEADGGNVTPLVVVGDGFTQYWQGYWGNVTGTITLEDASGNSMYQWSNADPSGEIYAVNTSAIPAWDQVICLNVTNSTAPQMNVTVSDIEGALGLSESDSEGINETFNGTFTGSFTIGSSVTINSGSGCGQVSLNVDDVGETGTFNQVILTDNLSDSKVIYAAILESDADTFRNAGTETADFQMIVHEDGTDATATDYYFYVELN